MATISLIFIQQPTSTIKPKIKISVLFGQQQITMLSLGISPLIIPDNIIKTNMIYPGNEMKLCGFYSLSIPLQVVSFPQPPYNQIINISGIAFIKLNISNYNINLYNQGSIYFSYVVYTFSFVQKTIFAYTYNTFQWNCNVNYYKRHLVFTPFWNYTTQNNIFFGLTSYFDNISFNLSIIVTQNVSSPSQFDFYCKTTMLDLTKGRLGFIIIGQPKFNCPIGTYLISYWMVISSICTSCSSSCSKCVSLYQYTDSASNLTCTGCYFMKYVNISGNATYGSCVCWPGLKSINGQCLQCESNCFQFNIQFFEVSDKAYFILTYTMPYFNELVPLAKNLKIYVNSYLTEYNIDDQGYGIRILSINITDMLNCQQSACKMYFQFNNPQKVLSSDNKASLSNNNKTLFIQQPFSYIYLLSTPITQGFSTLGMLIAGFSSIGVQSMFRMLFEMQQLIQAHKYVSLKIPLIFNQMVTQLRYFKFLDLSIFLPTNIVNFIVNIVSGDLDKFGQIKFKYYENGINFYKNAIMAILSCIILLIFNVMIYLLLKNLPWQLFNRLARKLQKRKGIILHDTLEQLVFPILLYSTLQIQFVIIKPNLIPIYFLSFIITTILLASPFVTIIWTFQRMEQHQHQQEIIQDMLLDNKLQQPITLVFYVMSCYRKVFFAIIFALQIEGYTQIYLFLVTNFIFLFFQFYILKNKIYKSILKILCRISNTLLLITLQILIILNNKINVPVMQLIDIGTASMFVTLIGGGIGIFQFFIKLFQTLFQSLQKKIIVPKIQNNKAQPTFRQQILCGIGHIFSNQKQQNQQKYKKELTDLHNEQKINTLVTQNNSSINTLIKITSNSHEMLKIIQISQNEDNSWKNIYQDSTRKMSTQEQINIFQIQKNKRKKQRKEYKIKSQQLSFNKQLIIKRQYSNNQASKKHQCLQDTQSIDLN